jgi:protease I
MKSDQEEQRRIMITKASRTKGTIAVLIEDHFDEAEFQGFNEFFPKNGYDLEYVSHLWNQKQITFRGNNLTAEVTVTVEINHVEPTEYDGIILIGAYAMDRLRYEANPTPGQPNQSPAVKFLRKAVRAMDANQLKIGTICHSLWLFAAAPELLKGRKVTCAHNLIYDVQNAGGIVLFEGEGTKNLHVEGNLITAKHPSVTSEFMKVFASEVENLKLRAVS